MFTFFRRISQIFFGPRRIYFRCTQHLFGRYQLVYVPCHDHCCSWRWWLKNLKFGAHFFPPRKQNSFWREKKKSKTKLSQKPSRVICAFVLLYLYTCPFFKNPKLKCVLLFRRNFVLFWSDTLMCNPAFPFTFFSTNQNLFSFCKHKFSN